MIAALLGRKIGMTQVYDDQGVLHPVTVVQAGPCSVLQIKNAQREGYEAVQIGFDDFKNHRETKPAAGHAAKAGATAKRFVKEYRMTAADADVAAGATLTVEVFEGVAKIDVIGTSKGKGYQGPMVRHGFKGMPASHGCERKHRSPGSICSHATQAGTGPKPKKGKRMGGHMGSVQCTSRNHRIIRIDKENNLLLIKGPLPGPAGGYLFLRASKTSAAASA
ncbi:MAG: 50S ribosomal protein L3 [Planctomycetaceae bacterium]|nr:50S ribosomal protein L3 [Planctomycetaceae bacterium]